MAWEKLWAVRVMAFVSAVLIALACNGGSSARNDDDSDDDTYDASNCDDDVIGDGPEGCEIQISQTSQMFQTGSNIAADAAGNFLITWEYAQGSCRDEYEIDSFWMNAFDATGSRIRDDEPVDLPDSNILYPALPLMNAAGDFVLIWQADSMGDSGGMGPYAQRFAADGTPLGEIFAVVEGSYENPVRLAAAMDDEGRFVVAWQDWSETVFFRIFDETGTPATGDLLPDLEHISVLAADSNGGFIAAGPEHQSEATIIVAQRFDWQGNALDEPFTVNDDAAKTKSVAAVVVNDDGDYAIVMQMTSDSVDYDVYLQRFDNQGNALGDKVLVNATTEGAQAHAAATVVDGGFVVTWESAEYLDALQSEVYARRFDDEANMLGGEFRVNTYEPEAQTDPHVVATADGGFVIVWQSWQQDGSGDGVFAKLYSAAGAEICVP